MSDSDELIGMDVIKHGESAYPVNAWVEYQYSKTNKIKGMISTMAGMIGMQNLQKADPEAELKVAIFLVQEVWISLAKL